MEEIDRYSSKLMSPFKVLIMVYLYQNDFALSSSLINVPLLDYSIKVGPYTILFLSIIYSTQIYMNIYIYIVIHRQTLSLCLKSSV